MPARPLSTQSLLELLDLFEQSDQSISDADGQRLCGFPGWDLARLQSLRHPDRLDWLVCNGYAGRYPASRGDEHVPVELEEDDVPGRYAYRCPETFRKKFVSASEVAVYSVSTTKILGQIATLLETPLAHRRGIESPAIDSVLWNLGKTRIGSSHVDVWFVRGFARSADAVFRYFHSATLVEQGLILSSGQPLPEFVRPPRNYRFATMRQVLVDYVPKPCIDMTLLHRILTTPADGTLPSVLAVFFDEINKVLTIRTKKDPWHIKGARQAAAVNYMYQQACKNRWLLDAGEILAAAYPKEQQVGKSRTMQSLFSGNKEWKDYIANPEKGTYSFCMD
jgi:hypothetical protein